MRDLGNVCEDIGVHRLTGQRLEGGGPDEAQRGLGGDDADLVAGLGAVLVFIVLEARPITRRVDAAIRRRTRERSEELERAITSSDLEERDREEDRDD